MSNAYLVNPTGAPEVCYRGSLLASTQALGNGTTTLTFDNSVTSTPTVIVSGNSIFTINTTGMYDLGCAINVATSGTWTDNAKRLFVEITRSSTAYVASGVTKNITSGISFISNIGVKHYLIAGDQIRFKFFQTLSTGTTTNTPTIATGGGTYAYISLLRTI
jgi:hypothetical protein